MASLGLRQVFASREEPVISEVENELQAGGVDFEEREDGNLPMAPPTSSQSLGINPLVFSWLNHREARNAPLVLPQKLHRILVRSRDMSRARRIISDLSA